ncbi:MAG: hypothetical protein GYB66_07805 [Chloroflexi bacterium]|nr:hypothetical protein [Chloroflexota bacterium]
MGLLLISSLIHAQDDDEEAEFVGTRECSGCHADTARAHADTAHALALQEVERDKDPILADFEQGGDLLTLVLPGEDEARPVTAEDVVLAIGSGRRLQAYAIEVDRNEYMVLPAKWSTQDAEWIAFTPADEWPAPAYDFVQNCAGCHTVGLNVRRGRWEDAGVSCESCHGPGSVHAEVAEEAGDSPSDRELEELRTTINSGTDPQICGQCHNRGVEPDDNHPFPVDYLPGDDLLAEDVFSIYLPPDESHWWPTGHAAMPNMQYNEWFISGHATALTSIQDNPDAANESCLQCHSADYQRNQALIAAHEDGDREGDPPEPVSVDTAQYGVTCTTCHNPHADPAETDYMLDQAPYDMCVSCHQAVSDEFVHYPVRELYEGETLVEEVEGIPSAHFEAEDGPDCLTCHMSSVPVGTYETRPTHTFLPVLPGDASGIERLEDSCTSCHVEQADAAAMQAFIDDTQASTQARIEAARAAIEDDAPAWVLTALAVVEGDDSLGVHNYAYIDALLDAIEAELGILPNESEEVSDE